jgi:hypothetical protein
VRNVLIDAGPLIALFAVDDAHHDRYDRLVTESAVSGLRLVTTWPCVIEASYIDLVSRRSKDLALRHRRLPDNSDPVFSALFPWIGTEIRAGGTPSHRCDGFRNAPPIRAAPTLSRIPLPETDFKRRSLPPVAVEVISMFR